MCTLNCGDCTREGTRAYIEVIMGSMCSLRLMLLIEKPDNLGREKLLVSLVVRAWMFW